MIVEATCINFQTQGRATLLGRSSFARPQNGPAPGRDPGCPSIRSAFDEQNIGSAVSAPVYVLRTDSEWVEAEGPIEYLPFYSHSSPFKSTVE